MEELQKAARAYYNNASQEVQGLAKELFQLMDTTQDGKISMVEFLEFFKQQDKGMDRSLFQSLDKNGNGQLEFDEFLTCYYIVKQRCLVCDSCKKKLLEMYFTCTTCFDSVADSYNLCVTCYGEKRFQHQHALFLDNHALLASKKVRPTDAYANQEEVPQPAGNGPSKRQQIQGALDKAVQTASSCGVM